MRVTGYTAAAAAEGKVHDGAFPGHPHPQSADGIQCFKGVEANAALGWPPAVVELYMKPAQDPGLSAVQPDGQAELHFAHGYTQKLPDRIIQL